jgi:hypothetical protein
MELQQFNILIKTKTILHFKLSNFGRKCVLLLLYVKYLCDHQNGFCENLFFDSPEKLLKWSSYTIELGSDPE